MKKRMHIPFTTILVIVTLNLLAQNTVITDDLAYEPDSSAVLDVYSQSKGLLIPRMNSDSRMNMENPANGLMVYDITLQEFYLYKNENWEPIAGQELWETNGEFIYMNHPNVKVGIGTEMPEGKLSVVGDVVEDNVPIFEVQNSNGVVVFAVYNNGVEILTDETAKGAKGGFAVGGLTPGKSVTTEYLKVTPDSIRLTIWDPAAGKGNKGGFAVGGLTPGKTDEYHLFQVTTDSTRVYIKQGSKGAKGGFAVGGLTPGKLSIPDFMSIDYSGINFNANGAPFMTMAPDGYTIFSSPDSTFGVILNQDTGFEPFFGKKNKNQQWEEQKNIDANQTHIIEQQKARIDELEKQLNEIKNLLMESKQ